MPVKELLTERLRLRDWRPEDAAALAAMNSDHEVMHFMNGGAIPPEKSQAGAKKFIAEGQQGPYGLWAIEEVENGAFHGWVALMPLEFKGPEIETGYRLPRASWGRGIATEATTRILDYGFDALALEEIVAVVRFGNDRSLRIMGKLSFAPSGERDVYDMALLYFRLAKKVWSAKENPT